MKGICRPPCCGSETGICDRSARGCTEQAPARGFQGGFIPAYMRKAHPRVVYRLSEMPSGWRLIAWHPDTSEMVTLDIRAERPLRGDEAVAAREWADRIDALLAPDQSWRLHADYA